MMLHFQTIYTVNQGRSRLKGNRYDSPWHRHRDDGASRDGDEMSVFTFSKQAQAESQCNLDHCLTVARDHAMSLLVITPNRIQVGGDGDGPKAHNTADVLFTKSWLREHNDWLESTSDVTPKIEESQHGQFVDFYTYRRSVCVQEHQGVYDVVTGQRIKPRREIIERMWALGFAAYRGRPLTMARPRWAGEREELEEITALADRYWTRRSRSDAAKKLVSTFTSINRYCAWPGAW